MSLYIIVTYNVNNMGGGQLYTLRRAKYLISKGYDVRLIVTYHTDNFPLREAFLNIPIYHIPEMGLYSISFTRQQRETIIDNIITKIEPYSVGNIYIESHTLSAIEWGEIIATRIGASHLAYPLSEFPVRKYRFNPGRKIFIEKLKKGEFWGCSSKSLETIFQKKCTPNNYINIGFDENELTDFCIPEIPYKKGHKEYVITTVSRLDKVYIEPLIKSVIRLALKYESQKIVLLVVGGSPITERKEYLFSKYSNLKISNLDIIFTDYINHLGKDLFQLTDLFVGMGTASINAINQGCITLNINPKGDQSMTSGYFGIDTYNFAYADTEKVYPLADKIEEAYLLSPDDVITIKQKGKELFYSSFEMNKCFNKLDRVILNLDPVENCINLYSNIFYNYMARTALTIKRILKRVCFVM